MRISLLEGSIPVCLFYFVIPGFIFLRGTDCLRNVRITSSSYVRLGEDARLYCDYDMEKASLYAVKWYRYNQEFYRYVPKEVPPQQVFQQGHVSVDMTGSNDHVVILRRVPFEISGKFKCVVSAELTFETIVATQELVVVAVGYASPSLFLDQDSYQVGETGRANCSVESTSPTANITWFLNDQEMKKSRQSTIVTWDKGDKRLSSVLSTLHFDIPDFLPFKLTCKAEVYTLYSESASIIIQPKPRAVAVAASNPENIFRPNGTASNKYLRGPFSNSLSRGPHLILTHTTIIIVALFCRNMLEKFVITTFLY